MRDREESKEEGKYGMRNLVGFTSMSLYARDHRALLYIRRGHIYLSLSSPEQERIASSLAPYISREYTYTRTDVCPAQEQAREQEPHAAKKSDRV